MKYIALSRLLQCTSAYIALILSSYLNAVASAEAKPPHTIVSPKESKLFNSRHVIVARP